MKKKNEPNRYELTINGNERVGDQFTSFSEVIPHALLKDACKALADLANHLFDEAQVATLNPPRMYEYAYVLDTQRAKVVASKVFIGEKVVEGLAAGVYLRINPHLVTPGYFEDITGISLPQGSQKAMAAGYYLMADAERAQNQSLLRKLRNKIINARTKSSGLGPGG